MPRSSTWSSLRTLGPVARCAIIMRHDGRCAWCHKPLTITIETDSPRDDIAAECPAEIDHVIMRKDGGTDDYWNLVPCCSDCNIFRPEGVTVPVEILNEPLDLEEGLQLALLMYPWVADRLRGSALRSKRIRELDRQDRAAERQAIQGEEDDDEPVEAQVFAFD